MFPFNQPGASQKQAPVLHRELNAAYSRKIHLERILVETRRSYSRDTDPHHTQMATPLVKVLKDLVEICTDPSHTEKVIPVVRVLRDWVKICDKLINYQGQDKDKIQSYNTQKKWFKEALTKIVLTREQSLSLAESGKDELEEVLEIPKSHYTLACDADRQQKAIPLVKALRDFAEGWGEFGKYQEQDKDRIKSYTKQKEILETALAINRKGADHEKIAKILKKSKNSSYSLEGFDKNNLDVEGVDPVEDAKTLHRLGNVHYRLKDLYREEKRSEHLKKAKEYYEKALVINECISHIGDIEVAEMLNNLGSIYHALKDYQKAKEHFEKALPIFEELNGSDDIMVGMVLRNMGRVYRNYEDLQKVKDPQKAEELQKARDLQKIENLKKAKESFEKALPIYKDVHGSEHIEVGITLNELGSVYYSLADLQKENEAKELYEKAKNLHQEALPIYEKFYGSDDVAVTQVLGNLDRDYYALENYQEAQKSHKKELVIYKRDLAIKEKRNPNSIEVAEALRNLGSTYYNLGSTCYSLGDFRSAKESYKSAEESYKKELEIRKRHYDSYTIEVVDRYRDYMYKATNVPFTPTEVLEENYRKEKVSREIKIAETLGNLGNIYLDEKDYQKAREQFKKALAIEEKHPDKFTDSNTLEKLNYIETTEFFIKPLEKTLAEKESNYPAGHLQIGQALRNLGDAYGELKDYQNQKESLEKALLILKKYLGDTNPTIQKVLEGLADAYKGLKNTEKAEQMYKEAATVKGECQKIALAVKNRNKPNSTLDSTSAHAASHSRSFF